MKCLLYLRQKLNKPRFLKITKVSIIIPIYNLEGYLPKCLARVRNLLSATELKRFQNKLFPCTTYKLKLFNFIPVFSYKERGTTTRFLNKSNSILKASNKKTAPSLKGAFLKDEISPLKRNRTKWRKSA